MTRKINDDRKVVEALFKVGEEISTCGFFREPLQAVMNRFLTLIAIGEFFSMREKLLDAYYGLILLLPIGKLSDKVGGLRRFMRTIL